MGDCKVCNHPRAFEIMAKVFSGDLTYVKAAELLNIPAPTVWNCFANHWQVEAEGDKVTMKAAAQMESVEDFVKQLRGTIRKFIKRLNEAMAMPVSAYNESAVTRLSAESRALMRDILEFEGKLKAAPLIQLNVLQVQMTKLTSFLFSELCENDHQKLLKILPELMQRESTGATPENTAST